MTIGKEYYFVARGATNLTLAEASEREQHCISGTELRTKLMGSRALKRALILDTCSSGQAITSFSTARGELDERKRILDALKDRAGTFILAGSAAGQDANHVLLEDERQFIDLEASTIFFTEEHEVVSPA